MRKYLIGGAIILVAGAAFGQFQVAHQMRLKAEAQCKEKGGVLALKADKSLSCEMIAASPASPPPQPAPETAQQPAKEAAEPAQQAAAQQPEAPKADTKQAADKQADSPKSDTKQAAKQKHKATDNKTADK